MALFPKNRTLNCRGRLVVMDRPLVMGILNAAPDSFYAGSRVATAREAVAAAGRMLAEGADILDIGGMSTRPGSERITAKEDARRVVPLVEAIASAFPDAILSIDTVYAHTARLALEAGARMVNDISAARYDEEILAVAAAFRVPYVLMHMQGDPASMQQDPVYQDAALEILDFFIERTDACRRAGITDIILDPGLGFGKRLADNYHILSRLGVYDILELPVLIGASRKSMITRLLDVPPEDALNGTTAVHMAALMQGADILRVHDVKAARECIAVYQALQEAESQ